MKDRSDRTKSRRGFLKDAGRIAVATGLASAIAPRAYAGEDNTIQVALIGCGGRGTGAAANALSTTSGPIKLVAMADVFDERLTESYNHLSERFCEQVEVPLEHQFLGFDAYANAMECLKPGDVAIFATPPAFRWVHFARAIEKGIHVFMEKPVTVDGPSSRRMFKLAEEAEAKNLKVGVGLMCRHCKARQQLFDRIQAGELGVITLLRAYRMTGPTGSAFAELKPDDLSELLYQIKNFHGFLWASGGAFSDFLIHNIDESCWMKNAWPVEAKASGGRHYRGDYVDQNFDSYSVEYTFADGTKLYLNGRNIPGCHQEFASYVHGTAGAGVISTAAHSPARCRTYKNHNMVKDNQVWAFPEPEPNPYQLEWDDLVDAIRNDKPYNEAKRGTEASLVTSMGRMAAHTGRIITWEEMLNCEHEFAPDVDKLTYDSPAPLQAESSDGRYATPLPGLVTAREF